MKFQKPKISNIIFLIVILLMIIPQTRQPIQVFLHKGLTLFSSPSEISEDKRKSLTDYNWTLQSLSGNTYDFSQTKNKVTFINFWATWCPPCIAEMPSIQDLHDGYSDKIEFLLVSDENQETINKFLSKHDYTFKIYRPISEVPELLETRSIPRTFIIDKNGTIVMDKSGAANWNSENVRKTLDKLLAE